LDGGATALALLAPEKGWVRRAAELWFTSEDRLRDVVHNFSAYGFGWLYPKVAGGRQGVVDDISHQGLGVLLGEGASAFNE
jgi:hypothetical protein